MFKRLFWLSVGAAAGFTGSVWAQRRVKRALERYLPDRVAHQVHASARSFGADLRAAASEGRTAMREREESLRSHLHR